MTDALLACDAALEKRTQNCTLAAVLAFGIWRLSIVTFAKWFVWPLY